MSEQKVCWGLAIWPGTCEDDIGLVPPLLSRRRLGCQVVGCPGLLRETRHVRRHLVTKGSFMRGWPIMAHEIVRDDDLAYLYPDGRLSRSRNAAISTEMA